MSDPKPLLIVPAGTQIVTRVAVPRADGDPLPAGSVAVVVSSPADATHAYRVRFPGGETAALRRTEFGILKHVKGEGIAAAGDAHDDFELFAPHVIYRCVVGSRAYGLDTEASDTDRRGVFLPPADLHWSLYGVPDQIERDATQECHWEIGNFLVMALKANPNVLEVLWSPIVEHVTPLGEELVALRGAFLSRLVYQTYNGYTLSQFRKLEQDLRTRGEVKWKHVMHLLRLLLSGIAVLRDGEVQVRVTDHRDELLAIRRGERAWADIDAWRLALHRDFERAYEATRLPERPDYERVNAFLVRARRSACAQAGDWRPETGGPAEQGIQHSSGLASRSSGLQPPASSLVASRLDPRLAQIAAEHRYPLVFATVSGAHLYGFPSPDSDWDLRGVHVLPPAEVMGLDTGPETVEVTGDERGLDLDLVTHDARKFFNLLLKANGYVLEQLHSPLVVTTTPEHAELREIARDAVTRHHVHHYLGFAANQRRLFERQTPPRVKPLLYVYRVLLTGIHLMRTGEVEANLVRLNDVFRLPYVPDLVARKTGGEEKSVLDDADLAFHRTEFERLDRELKDAGDATKLRDAPPPRVRAALNDLLLRLRAKAAV